MPEARTAGPVHPNADGFNRHFDPKAYLAEMFSAPDDEDRFSVDFIVRMLAGLPDDLLVHEFGGGPALYSVAALAPKAREIHFSDAAEASLREVDLWLQASPRAHDWGAYIALALETEGRPRGADAIAARARCMRARVTRLMRCDGQANPPIESGGLRYDLVSAHHCTDVAAATFDEWKAVLRNVTTLVRPGGWLLLSVTTGADAYQVEQVAFACANLSTGEIIEGLVEAGYLPDSIRLETYQVEQEREYGGIASALARLAGQPGG